MGIGRKGKPVIENPKYDGIYYYHQIPPAHGDRHCLTALDRQNVLDKIKRTDFSYPGIFKGRGIVICGGGEKLFTCAWVCINMLRTLGCKLPIEFWHLGPGEVDAKIASLLSPLGVKCVDACKARF